MLTYPQIDPVLVAIGPLAIRWYALAYLAGLMGGVLWARHLAASRRLPLTQPDWDRFLTYAVIGVVVGGRVGYCLLYQPSYYLSHPLEIVKIWQGGMAFHGGFIGVVAAVFAFCTRHRKPLWPVADCVAASAPIGLFFGRLANFINGELYGRITDVPWAMVFPGGGVLPRHPSQLYEAVLEGGLLFLLLHYAFKRTASGQTAALFVAGYGAARFLVEFTRAPDSYLGLTLGLSNGQWYSLPMVIGGLVLFVSRRPRAA